MTELAQWDRFSENCAKKQTKKKKHFKAFSLKPVTVMVLGCWSGVKPSSVIFLKHTGHRMPFYFIPVSVSLRVARTLLKRLLGKN